MARLRISQLAERVGVPATTLRYYESQGLLPVRRTANGYRAYRDDDVDRIRFIATAKELGLSLTRIRELLEVWQDGMCRDVRSRLLPLVADQIVDLDARMRDLHTLRRHLTDAQDHLHALPSRDTPCDPDCTFLTSRDDPADPPSPEITTLPIACSLTGTDHTTRLAAWHAALAGTVPRRLDDATVGTPIPHDRIASIAALVADETQCCPFLTFRITVTADGARLDATAPAEARALLDDLFPAGSPRSHPC